jgi:hypothetical protein
LPEAEFEGVRAVAGHPTFGNFPLACAEFVDPYLTSQHTAHIPNRHNFPQ